MGFFQLSLVYIVCNFFKFSPDLHNLNKSSIFPPMGLYRFKLFIFLSNIFLMFFIIFWACFSLFIFEYT